MLPNPIIVVGVGRSGTSITAKILHELGVFMGNTFVPPDDTNPDGFYEDIEFMFLNRFKAEEGKNVKDVDWYEQVIPLIKRRHEYALKNNIRWGFKSPHTSELLAYYTRLVPDAQWIFCDRRRIDLIESLVQTYSISTTTAENIIQQRIYNIRRFLSGKYHKVPLEELKKHPEVEIQRLCKFIGVEYKDLSSIVRKEKTCRRKGMILKAESVVTS